jgi:hypothetical protein
MTINFNHRAKTYQQGLLIDGTCIIDEDSNFTNEEIALYDNELTYITEDLEKHRMLDYMTRVIKLDFKSRNKARMCYFLGHMMVRGNFLLRLHMMRKIEDLSKEVEGDSVTEMLEAEYQSITGILAINKDGLCYEEPEEIAILCVCYLAGALNAIIMDALF